ncbi:MAG: DUF1461 domain-containing protein [archaeon]
MKSYQKIFLAILVLSIVSIVLFSTIFSYLFNMKYYESKYLKYHIYDIFTKNQTENATQDIFDYFHSVNDLDPSFFNKDEINHLTDVKRLLESCWKIYLMSLILFWGLLFATYIIDKKRFASFFSLLLFYSGIVICISMVIIATIYFTIGFDALFLKFHEIVFTGNYAFDPAVSNMKAMFPDLFFFEIARNIIVMILIKGILLTFVGYFMKRRFNL